MDQVSKPVLIALVAAVALLGAKFTILRSNSGGGGSTPASATAPGQTGLQSAIDKANNAVGVSKQSATSHENAAAAASGDSTPATSAPASSKPSVTRAAKPAAAKPAAKPTFKPVPKLAPGDKSGPMLADLARGRVVVALFFNPHGSDDNAALRAVRQADKHGGRVVVHSIPIADVGNYDAITTGVQVLEAPTIIVMGPNHKARTIVGYTEVKEVDQTVGDVGGKAFAAKAPKARSAFVRKIAFVCDGTGFGIDTAGAPTSVGELVPFLNKGIGVERHDRATVAALHPHGAREMAAKRALLRAYDTDMAAAGQLRTSIKSGAPIGPAVLNLLSAEKRLIAENRPALRAVGSRCLG